MNAMETLPKNLNDNIFYANSKKSSTKQKDQKKEESERKESSHYSFVNMMSNDFNSARDSIRNEDKWLSYKSDDVVVNL